MLHIVNGDSATETLKQSEIGGEHVAFREVLQEGPAPQGLSADEWFSTRARFLADDYELDMETCRKSLLEQQDAIERFRDHEEVVLWFSHDLSCQIALIYLLSWFAEQERNETRLSLICVGEFPGVAPFTCYGQLTVAQMASLFEQRHEVMRDELDLAARAWRAYRLSTPESMLDLVGQDTAALPYLRGTLLRHLARFPSRRNGLGYVQSSALRLISQGRTSFKNLFPAFGSLDPAYGLGDCQVWKDLLRMSRVSEPLIIIRDLKDPKNSFAAESFHEAGFELTDEGRAVLAGKSDFIAANGIDQWFGGVHMTQSNVWRWDEQNHSLVRG